jgi:phytoene dehydrogenase-like protein
MSLPLRTASDLLNAARTLNVRDWPLARFVNWSMGDALRAVGLRGNKPLVGLLSMLIEDTVHSTVDDAPLINAALGITIRGVGLTRPLGGMYGFWKRFIRHYRSLGGQFRLNCPVLKIEPVAGDGHAGYRVHTAEGALQAAQVVSTLPVSLTENIASDVLGNRLAQYSQRNENSEGGAVMLFLGVPEREVAEQALTHHHLLLDYDLPLGNGNNMFISVSAPGDVESAPAGYRSVMVSTHSCLKEWEGLTDPEYHARKTQIAERLLAFARRVYPTLGANPTVFEVATPRTYERFTRRPRGAVGGFRLHRGNSNQKAIPHDLGVAGFWLGGDTTWPGLGTVACVLGSQVVSRHVLDFSRRGHGGE